VKKAEDEDPVEAEANDVGQSLLATGKREPNPGRPGGRGQLLPYGKRAGSRPGGTIAGSGE